MSGVAATASSSSLRRWAPYAAGVLAVLSYIFLSSAGSGPGLPLDDGWIHQTYARNLAQTGRWEFAPGVLSAGSTSPLWTVLLAAGYVLRVPYLLWTYLLGVLSLLGLSGAAMRLWRVLWPAYARRDWLAGTVPALTWPLVWAAASGMETLLFMALGFWLLAQFMSAEAGGARMGLAAGLLMLARPEGLILVVLLAVALLWQRRWSALGLFCAAALLPLLPYFFFNLTVSGVLWPNTFYAKQTEYAALLARPLAQRFLQLLYFSLGGPESGWRGISSAHLLLVPGLAVAGWRALHSDISHRRLWRSLPLLWAGGHVLAYATRLPVTYQHGRYLWAAMPVWILFGLAGWGQILTHLQRNGRQGYGHLRRLLAQVAVPVFAVLLLLFLILGAQAYADDVAFIENEMVDVALWLSDNTPAESLVAAHDIGAIGYFARRPLLDLAGLITPQVIPLLDDEEALARYVRDAGADYLITAPGWPYRVLTVAQNSASAVDARLLYSTDFEWTREQGLNNVEVWRLR